jgi:hypothetical protein
MTTGSVAEEAELLFFNAVFHLTPSTVELVVETLCAAAQISDDETRIGTLDRLLSFGDNASFSIPTLSLVLKLPKEANFLAAFSMLALGSLLQLGTESFEPLILGYANDVIDLVSLTPAQHFPSTESAIGSQRDFDFRPLLS